MIVTANIKFKHAELVTEFFELLHPSVRAIVVELARFVDHKGWAPVTLTQVSRSEETMAEYYGPNWKKKGKFSWHLVNRAVDIRNRDWSPEQRKVIEAWLKTNWPGAEVLMHDIGRGNHLHVANPRPWSAIKRLRRYITIQRATQGKKA